MRNLFGTAVAVALSMMVLPNCCSTANAGMSIAVSVGPSAGYGYPAEYTTAAYGYPECTSEEVNWDNAFVINDNRIGMWVWLPVGRWVVRCCNISYDREWNEVRFGPWWYDYSIPYTYHFDNAYYNYCPFHTVRFHDYMTGHYPDWHNRYFAYNHDRYQPRTDRQIVVSHERYGRPRNDAPAVHRQSVEQVKQCRPATTERTTMITRETKRPVGIDGGNRTVRIDQSNNDTSRPSTEITRTRTTTRDHSDRCGTTTTQTNNSSREMGRR